MTPVATRARWAAGTGLALVLAVILLSAAIRLGQAATPPMDAGMLLALRALHRTAASLEVLAAGWLAWLAWRVRAERPWFARGALLAVLFTIALSVLGIVAGQKPPPAAAAGNLLGGLALAAVFAWTLAVLRETDAPMRRTAAVLLVVQCLLGARLAALPGAASSAALPLHAILGILLALAAGWLALRCRHALRRRAGLALALLVPIAGFTALHYETSARAAFVHAATAALLVIAGAYSRFRPA